MNVIVTHVPQYTNLWMEEEHREMLEDTRVCHTRVCSKLLDEKSKILMMGNFNCKEVSWGDWTMETIITSWESKTARTGHI